MNIKNSRYFQQQKLQINYLQIYLHWHTSIFLLKILLLKFARKSTWSKNFMTAGKVIKIYQINNPNHKRHETLLNVNLEARCKCALRHTVMFFLQQEETEPNVT